MSLLHRLLWSVTVAITVILLGALVLSIGSARMYLQGTLQSQGENAVSSLAIALSQPANQDPITQELLMTALFDSGQFASVRMVDPAGQTMFARERQPTERQAASAPAWFVQALPLPSPMAQRAVSDGWKQVGMVRLVVDNAYATTALWDSSLKMAAWVVGAGLVWSCFVIALLGWFQRVLREEVTRQVLEIGAVDSLPVESRKPVLAELAPVTAAISTTHERVVEQAQEQSQRIDSLELETHQDPITGLPNRKYFLQELHKTLAGQGVAGATPGYVMLVRQRDLQAMNMHLPRATVDEWLRDVGQQWALRVAQWPLVGVQLARLNGSDFAMLIPGDNGPEVMHAVHQLRTWLQSQSVALPDGQWTRWAYAMTDYLPHMSSAQVLARVDHALMQAESAGHGDVEYTEVLDRTDAPSTQGGAQWKQLLQYALETPNALQLQVQAAPWLPANHAGVWHEASLQLTDAAGAVLQASYFLPAATRLGLSAEMDARATALALDWLSRNVDAQLVVRVSMPSLAQAGFMEQLHTLLESSQASQGLMSRLCFEIDAHALVVYRDLVAQWSEAVHARGVGVGLRRLDQQPQALSCLQALPLRYVKIGAQSIAQSLENAGQKLLLEAMVRAAHAQGIRVYVVDAVCPESAAWLQSLGVEGYLRSDPST